MSYFGPKDFYLEAAQGNVPGVTLVSKFGANPDVEDTQTEDIWFIGGEVNYLTAAETLTVSSSIDEDDGIESGGLTGARVVHIVGLDAEFNELSEDVTMHGVADVTTSGSYLRVTRAYVEEVGSLNINEGNIAIEESGTETDMAYIQAGFGQTQIGHYTVPTGKTAYITAYEGTASPGAGTAAARSGMFRLFTREQGKAWRLRVEFGHRSDGGAGQIRLDAPIVCPAQCDIRWEFESKSANVEAYIKYAIALVDD